MNDSLLDDLEKDLDSIVSPSSEMVPSWQAHLHQTVESDPYKLLTAVSCVEIIVNITAVGMIITIFFVAIFIVIVVDIALSISEMTLTSLTLILTHRETWQQKD